MDKELEESIKLTVEGAGCQLYDIVTTKENKQDILRVFITKDGGVSIDDCANISRLISPLLDVNDPIDSKYFLEVSSPGIERKLKTLNHFKHSIGDMVKIKEFSTEVFKGKLIDVTDEGKITLKLENSKDIFETTFDDILSASTYFVWK